MLFLSFITKSSTRQAGELGVISFCEGKKRKKKSVVEKAEIECCDSKFDMKKQARTWKI
jgi:hypothetical protein